MVTEAGKELLRNTINTANFHNKILEENEMWKQWELECGLTMMVSDDDVLKRIRKHHQCSKHRKRDKSKERDEHKSNKTDIFSAGPSNIVSERWDHSGFKELYPDEDITPKPCSSTSSKSNSSKHKKKKRKHHRKSSTSDSEIWEEFKRYKRSKTNKQKLKPKEREVSSHSFDSHVKEWRKMKKRP